MKKLVLSESAYEVPSGVMERLIKFVEESNKLFFFALLKIVSNFHFLKVLSNLSKKGKQPNFDIPEKITKKDESFLSFLSWLSIVRPFGNISFRVTPIVKVLKEKREKNELIPRQRMAELKIVLKGICSETFLSLEEPEVFLTRLLQNFEGGKENIQQVLRELTIFFILYDREELFSSQIWDAFNLLWGRINNPLYCLFQDLIREAQEDKKTTLSKLLILLYELKIIFSSEIIFNPEFCVD